MNMVWIHAGETIGREITEMLDEAGIPSYSVWRNVLHRDNLGESTHWDDAVFPGTSRAIQFLCCDETLSILEEKFRSFLSDDYVRQTGFEVYIHKAERLM